MHNHEPEVIGKRVRKEEPVAREVLEPDLRFGVGASVDDCKSSVLHFRVDIESVDFLPIIVK